MYYNFHPSNNWVRGTAYPKTPQLVFQPATTLPVLRVTGAGTPVRQQIRALQPPQVNYSQVAPLAGYGGVSAGMMYGYPLAANALGQPLNQAGIS